VEQWQRLSPRLEVSGILTLQSGRFFTIGATVTHWQAFPARVSI